MKKLKEILAIILVVWSIVATFAFFRMYFFFQDLSLVAVEPSPTPPMNISSEMEQAFINTIDSNADLNSGIRIGSPLINTDNQPAHVSFRVYSYTDEPVTFINRGFNPKIFYFDGAENIWQYIEVKLHPAQETILPANLTTLSLDPDIYNVRDITPATLAKVPTNQARLYISGIGVETGIEYGAYLDIELTNHTP